MAVLLSVHHLPIVLSIHGERPSMTRLSYHNSDIRLPNQIIHVTFDLTSQNVILTNQWGAGSSLANIWSRVKKSTCN